MSGTAVISFGPEARGRLAAMSWAEPLLQRTAVTAYAQILTGSMARLILQAVYFAALVNALSLADYGVFAAALAMSLILAGGGAFGFTATMFRAATTRRRILGAYLTAFIAYAAVESALLILCGAICYLLILRSYLPFGAFMAVLVSETVFWRLGDMLNTVSIGLGRYRNGIAIGVIASGGRLGAILLFALSGQHGVAAWTLFYVAGNAVATATCLVLFWPRVRLRWEARILRRRLKEAVSFWAINTLQTFQIEADKLIVLWLAGDSHAGVYALSMRIIELMLVPIKNAFPPYVKSLLRSKERFANWRRSLGVEAALAVTALALFGGAVVALHLFPHLLGANVARAAGWFQNLPLLPVSRALLDYHREVMFAAERLATYAIVASILAATRLATIATVLSLSAGIEALPLPLNILAVVLYVISASVVWTQVIRPPLGGMITGWRERRSVAIRRIDASGNGDLARP